MNCLIQQVCFLSPLSVCETNTKEVLSLIVLSTAPPPERSIMGQCNSFSNGSPSVLVVALGAVITPWSWIYKGEQINGTSLFYSELQCNCNCTSNREIHTAAISMSLNELMSKMSTVLNRKTVVVRIQYKIKSEV